MTGHLRVVPDDPTTNDPAQEIRDGIALVDRLATNPLLSRAAVDALPIMRGFLTRSLPPQRASR